MNFQKSIMLFFIFSVGALSLSAQKHYTYIDGNNNEYQIISDSVFYLPVSPIESSSGEYSGGEPMRKKISPEQFSKIEALIKSLLKDKSNHIKSRNMGCGTLVVGKKTTFIQSSSKLKEELEMTLKICLD
jgi:hypothetical protein